MVNPSSLLRLSSSERWLLAQSGLLLLAVRLGLWVVGFRTVRSLLQRLRATPCRLPQYDPAAVGRIAWAVGRMSRYVPVATCLTRALAAEALMRWHGLPATLRIGVA